MGSSLARNFSDKGVRTVVFNRSYDKTKKFIAAYGGKNLFAVRSLVELTDCLEKPAKILLMVTAGAAVDQLLGKLSKLLKAGDVIIDGGNSHFAETQARAAYCRKRKIHWAGLGISGGVAGALQGPSLMFGGDAPSWTKTNFLLEKIAARDFQGHPCLARLGDDGAGHYVKMVHNGIEYAIMQLLGEIYDYYRKKEGLAAGPIAALLKKVSGRLGQVYLLEAAAKVLSKKSARGNLIDLILDCAAASGTGHWTSVEALKLDVAIPSIDAAVTARQLSNLKKLRERLSVMAAHKDGKRGQNNMNFDPAAVLKFGLLSFYAQGCNCLLQLPLFMAGRSIWQQWPGFGKTAA